MEKAAISEPNTTAKNPLGYQPIGKLLRSFALPAIISCLVNSIYNIVDQIFIGQGVGYLGNAATTISFPIMTVLAAFATLVGTGGSAYAALKLGEKKEEAAQKTLNNVLVLGLILSAAIMVVGLLALDPMLRMLGATEASLPYAHDYAFVILLGTPFSIISIALSNMARTDGSPNLSMYSILIGAVLNTILDPVYIFVLHWGVTGAAIATITSQLISTIVLTVYFARKGKSMQFHKKYMRLSGRVCKMTFMLGISSFVTQVVACVMQVVMNNTLVYYGNQSAVGGDVALSAMGIVMKVAMILASACIGIGIGAQPILGFNRGARQPKRIKQTYVMAAWISTAVVSVAGLLCQLFPEQILNLFGSEDANFTAFAIKAMHIALIGIFCSGFQIVSTSYFQATGQPLKATILSMLRQMLLLIPMMLIMPLFFGLDGVLFAFPIADIGSAVIVAFFMVYEMKKLNRWIRQEDEGQLIMADI
ncbi:MATE family efflux transporter [Christensenella timonensis]|uniref:MATE family efflux transporter n=1 Tax=Christensenella timonensis TaxID=1816678 RepID=UPI00082DE739|nr:MATE family efflux transporter [Christensenella timonensis]